MKADRLLNALLMLQARGRMTGRELAELLEVSERTVHRDMEALSASGVPVFALRGSQGGWRLDENWRTEVPGLNEAELRALLMAQPRTLGDPRMVAAAEAAYNKLIASLPRTLREQAAVIRERLHVDPSGWHVTGEDLSMLPAVQEAVAQDRCLAFQYMRSDGDCAARTVDPLGIVAKGASWYLVARAPAGMRTYRISRMSAVISLEAQFKRPQHFDLERYWQESTVAMEERKGGYKATLCMEPKAARSLAAWSDSSPAAIKSLHAPDHWVTLDVEFDAESHARFVVLGFGPRVQVLAPTALRRLVIEDAAAILAQDAQWSS